MESSGIRRVAASASLLAFFQVVGLALPLLTLPVLTRALGVELFGQVMLAQFIVFFGVVFIDSGFNVESHRRVAVSQDTRGRLQSLLDNLLARGLLALGVALVVVLIGWLTPGLPLWMVLMSLLHLVGTLLFPQWWFIAREQGLRMGLAGTAGRVVSTVVILVFVHEPGDVGLALLAACSATAISGLLVAPALLRELASHRRELNGAGFRPYLRAVRPVIFSGFVASSAQSVPTVLLGWIGGPLQVGLFSAADRLTRAAAHVSTVAGQSLLNIMARLHHAPDQGGAHAVRHVLGYAGAACAAGSLTLIVISGFAVQLLYGEQFLASAGILQILALWLGLYVFRGLWVMVGWTSRGHMEAVARLQWMEGTSVIVLAGLGAFFHGGAGVAVALILTELGLLTVLAWIRRSARAKDRS